MKQSANKAGDRKALELFNLLYEECQYGFNLRGSLANLPVSLVNDMIRLFSEIRSLRGGDDLDDD